MSQKPALNTKQIKKKEPVEKKNNKDINYKKVFKVFDEYYKLVNVEFKKYLKGQISSDELDEKQNNELQEEYDYSGLAISLGLYKDIRGNRYIDPDIEKKLKKDSKNYQEFLELIKKPPPIDPIEDDEDIDDWEGEDLRCYLDNYLRYGKPESNPWSEVKKTLAKEHQSFDKYKKHLLQGYKTLLTTEKDQTLKNCGDKKFNDAMKQYKAIDQAKNYKEYGAIYRNLNFKGIKAPPRWRLRKRKKEDEVRPIDKDFKIKKQETTDTLIKSLQEPKTQKEYKFDSNDIRQEENIIYYEKDKIEIQLQPINLGTVELLFFESDSNIKGLARLKLCQFLNYYNNQSSRKDNIKIIVKAVNYSGKFKSLNELVKLYEKMSFKFNKYKEPQASGETTIKDFLKFCESYRLGQPKN